MKKYLYTFGALALAFTLGGMPVIVLAEDNDRAGQVVRVQGQQRVEVSNSDDQNRLNVRIDQDDDDFDLEESEDEEQASSSDDLNRRIQVRKLELDDEEASTTPETRRNAVKNANPVRVAVHSLLASRDLIDHGGIGQQVSEIAKEMNRSIASTTNAEVKIESRSFLSRLFFGGDKTSAEVIAQEASRNQARIEKLTELLGQASTTPAVQATLTTQITVLKEAQARIQALADREKSAWGLFSWRF